MTFCIFRLEMLGPTLVARKIVAGPFPTSADADEQARLMAEELGLAHFNPMVGHWWAGDGSGHHVRLVRGSTPDDASTSDALAGTAAA